MRGRFIEGAARAAAKTRRLLRGAQPDGPWATIELLREPGEVECTYGDIFFLDVRVHNTGRASLDSHRAENPDFLSYHWESPSGENIEYNGLRTPILEAVPPGKSANLRARVSVVPLVESAVLVLDLVREGDRWLSTAGGGTLRIPCRISTGSEVEELLRRLDSPGGFEGRGLTVEELWGERAEVKHSGEEWGWMDHITVLEECIFPKLASKERNWVLTMLERHGIPRGGDWLSLGCGDGGLELWLLEKNVAGSIVGLDVSPHAVEVARQSALEKGASNAAFEVIDLNRESLPRNTYDVILTSMSLHHLFELEHVFTTIRGALREGGYLLASEYVGPSRFQFPLEQIDLAERILSVLPRELRFDPVTSKQAGRVVFKDRYYYHTLEHWQEIDPSEAVRSAELIGQMKRAFEDVWVYPFGGTLLHLVLEFIISNFDPDSDRDRALIKLMDVLESELIRTGTLRSDFAVLVARR